MPEIVEISVENRLDKDGRAVNVYHHATRGTHIISYNSLLTIPLQIEEEGDYLHISVVSGPGHFWQECVIALPAWASFELASEGKLTFHHSSLENRLIIPPGPPLWRLKITRRTGGTHAQTQDRVTISDR
jgi:hypothetical protein